MKRPCINSMLALALVSQFSGQAQGLEECDVAPDGLVSWWRGENDTSDVMGANGGVLFDGASYQAGRFGAGFHFDGVDDLVEVESRGIFRGGQEATIEAWVRPTGPHSNDGQVYAENTGAGYWTRFGLFVHNDGRVEAFGRPGDRGTPSFSLLSSIAIPLNEWSHLVATWQAETGLRVYINGVERGALSTVVGGFSSSASALIAVGGGRDSFLDPTEMFNGDIDEVSVYLRALLEAEVQRLFLAPKCLPAVNISRVGASVRVSWPQVFNTLVLQSVPNLGNAAQWADVLLAPGDDGAERVVLKELGDVHEFYRLRGP